MKRTPAPTYRHGDLMRSSKLCRFLMVGALAPAVTLAAACAADADVTSGDETPWTTTVDSTGDTVVLRIAGGVPERLVRRLVPELTVGSLDGAVEETFGSIATVVGLPDGGLLVFDDQAGEVRRFDSTGAFVHVLGRKGGGPGEYGHVNGIQILPDGRIALWDAAGNRMNLYAPDGEFLATWRLAVQGFYASNILQSDASGALYLWAPFEHRRGGVGTDRSGVIRLDSAGSVVDSTAYPSWRTGEPAIMMAQSADGGMSTAWSVPFMPDVANALLKNGGIVSGPEDPYVFYLLPPPLSGALSPQRPVRVEREYEPVAVTDAEAADLRERITASMRRVDPKWTWQGADVPSTKPAYRDIQVGRDGSIWVSLFTPAERIPEAELEPVGASEPNASRRTTREPIVFDVYAPDGRLMGRVAAPPRTEIHDMSGSTAWGVQRDSLDVPYAVRFRVEPALPRE